MISRISGKVVSISEQGVIVDVHGVGFSIFIGKAAFEKIHAGDDVLFFTHLVVREDRFELYGFLREAEKKFFEQLVKVRDVGPKTAVAILSLGNLAEVQQAIIHGDVATLTSVPGIGKKTAERIILELKEKVFAESDAPSTQKSEGNRAIEAALVHLGYSSREAKEAVNDMPRELRTDDERLRWVLKKIGGNQ
jgi:Holliday junction DNA helicase RuvA